MKRKSLSKSIRFDVLNRDNFTCQYCGKSAPNVRLEIDHIIPVANGGKDDLSNLITSCYDCNRGKRDKSLDTKETIETKQKNERKPVSFRLDENTLDKLHKYSSENKISFTDTIRKALDLLTKSKENNETECEDDFSWKNLFLEERCRTDELTQEIIRITRKQFEK